jgi:hypothetical protein
VDTWACISIDMRQLQAVKRWCWQILMQLCPCYDS